MFSRGNRRSGFTLPEVLVTVAIVAVLAAAVVPTVISQMGKGEAGSVVSDFNALSLAVTQFVTDTRKYPGTLRQLNVDTAVQSGDPDLMGGTMGIAGSNSWKGPYLATTQTLLAADNYDMSGFSIEVEQAFQAPDNTNGYSITAGLTRDGGTFTEAQILAIDRAIDGGNGAVATGACATTQPNGTSGRLTWTSAGAGTPCTISLVKYRLVPTGR